MSGRVGRNDVIYRPKNIKKYVGTGKVVCRSSWEMIFCKWADNNPAVIEWASEPMGIPYVDRATKDFRGMPKKRKYYPDFIIKVRNRQGTIDTWMVEVKPLKETKPPRQSKNKSQKTRMHEAKTWGTNQSKWRAAEAFCERRGWFFRILTEKDLIKG